MLMNTGHAAIPSKHGLLSTLCYQMGPNAEAHYALEANPNPNPNPNPNWRPTTPSRVPSRWLGSGFAGSGTRCRSLTTPGKSGSSRLRLTARKARKRPPALCARELPQKERREGEAPFPSPFPSVSGAGLYLVPAFSGLLAPHWRPDARGVMVGLTQFHTKVCSPVRVRVRVGVGVRVTRVPRGCCSESGWREGLVVTLRHGVCVPTGAYLPGDARGDRLPDGRRGWGDGKRPPGRTMQPLPTSSNPRTPSKEGEG